MSKKIDQMREAVAKDANYIYDMDLKCFDDPWTKEQWTEISQNPNAKVWVGCYRQVPISMLVLERNWFFPPGESKRSGAIHIHRLCVKELFRYHGNGLKLLLFAQQQAQQSGVHWITVTVAEWLLDKRHPHCCLPWLQRYNFRALQTLPDKVPMYGQLYSKYLFGFCN